jgi:hypothetical protein
MTESTKTDLFIIAFLVVIGAVIVAADLLHAKWVYGDWKCGLPEVHCRKVVP